MLEQRVVRWLYRRLGRRYKLAFLATQIPTSIAVGLVFIGLLSSYYHPSASEFLIAAGTTTVFVTIGVGYALMRYRTELSRLFDWRELKVRNDEETIAAWDAAMNLPLRSFRRNSLLTNAVAAIPSIAVTMIVWDLPLSALPPLLAVGDDRRVLRHDPHVLDRRAADAPGDRGDRRAAARGRRLHAATACRCASA